MKDGSQSTREGDAGEGGGGGGGGSIEEMALSRREGERGESILMIAPSRPQCIVLGQKHFLCYFYSSVCVRLYWFNTDLISLIYYSQITFSDLTHFKS